MAFLFNFAKLRFTVIQLSNKTSFKLLSNNCNKFLMTTAIPILSKSNTIIHYHSKYNLWPAIVRDRPEPKMVKESEALSGRDDNIMDKCADNHTFLKTKTKPPFPDGTESIIFGMGCFWGAERMFWKQKDVYSTQVGYAGGFTKNPTYKEVCSGQTGHTEVVRVVYDPKKVKLSNLLQVFFNEHDPTEGYRQGNDVGTQYRSAIYWTTKQQEKLVRTAAEKFGKQLPKDMKVTTELAPLSEFYYAEDYHQQYLHKNPNGYCGLRGSGYKLEDEFEKLNVDKNEENDEQKDPNQGKDEL